MFNWVRSLFHPPKTKPLAGGRRSSRRLFPSIPRLEPLEDREVLSIVGTFSGPATTTVGPNVNISRALGNQNESTIAVNPLNPSQLFAAANQETLASGIYMATSSDGGVTWTGKVRADGTDGLDPACCDAEAVWDNFGNLFLTYLAGANLTDIVVYQSSDGGVTFNQAGLFTDAGGPDQPKIAAGEGEVWVTWTDSSFNREIAGAAVQGLGASQISNFSPAQVLRDPSGNPAQGDFGGIAIGPNGEVIASYQPGNPSGPEPVYVNVNTVGVGGFFGRAVQVAVTQVGGVDTNIPAQSNNFGIDAEAKVAFDHSGGPHNGRAYVVFTQAPNPNSSATSIVEYFSDDDGSTWNGPVPVSIDPGANSKFLPNVSVDEATGAIGVAWYDARMDLGNGGPGDTDNIPNDDAQLWGAVSTDGGQTFSPNFPISAGTSNSNDSEPPGAFSRPLGYGDFNTSDFTAGRFYRIWADNSNSTGDNPDGKLKKMDLYTAPVTVGGETVTATSQGISDSFYLTLDPTGVYLDMYENSTPATGKPTFIVSLASVNNVVISAGNKTPTSVTVDYLNGNPVPAGGIQFNGGSGSNKLTVLNNANSWNITGKNAGTVNGGIQFSNVSRLTGGNASDLFKFSNGATVTGMIDGGGTQPGPDTLDFTNDPTASFNVLGAGPNHGNQGTDPGGTFQNIDSFVGGNSILHATDTNNVWTITGSGSGTLVEGNSAPMPFTGASTLVGGALTDTFIFAGGTIGKIDGGGGVNTIQGANSPNTWSITGPNAGALNGIPFANIQNLVGGNGADTFQFSQGGSVSGTINGGKGVDVLDYSQAPGATFSVAASGSVDGVSGTASGVASFDNINSFVGLSTLVGTDTSNIWTLTGPGSGNVSEDLIFSFAFSNLTKIVGGSQDDTFMVAGGSISSIDGGAGPNVLQSGNGANTWTISGVNSGSLNTIGFANIQTLVGGNGSDKFVVTTGGTIAGTLDGGGSSAGPDTLDFSGDPGAAVSVFGAAPAHGLQGYSNGGAFVDIDSITGETTLAGTNTDNIWTITGANSGSVNEGGSFVYNFKNVPNLLGGSMSDQFFLSGGTVASINGGGGVNSLFGDNLSNGWIINGQDAGALNQTTFTSIQNLTGGANGDTFTFLLGGSVAGNVDGGVNGPDALDYSHLAGAAYSISGPGPTHGNTGTATGIGGIYQDIDNLVNATTLQGSATANVWDITGPNSGTVTEGGTIVIPFSNTSSLEGNSVSDDFIIHPGGSIGAITGGSGVETLDLSAIASVTVSLTGLSTTYLGTATAGVTSSFSGISEIIGSNSNRNALLGPQNTSALWQLEGPGLGFLTSSMSGKAIGLTFTGFQTLIGRSAGNILVGTNNPTDWAISGRDTGVVFNYLAAFGGMSSLIGGAGNDRFFFGSNASLDGYVDGGGGNNLLDFTQTGGVQIALTGLGPTSGFQGLSSLMSEGFTNIDNVAGSIFNNFNVLFGTSNPSAWLVDTANGVESYFMNNGTLPFSNFQVLVGGKGGNLFMVHSTPANQALVMYGTGGADSFQITSDAPTDFGTTAEIGGPIGIVGGSGTSQIVVGDRADATGGASFITGNVIIGAVAPQGVYYSSNGGGFAGGVFVLTGSGQNNVTVTGTPANSFVELVTGGGDDTISVQAPAGSLGAALPGALVIDAGAGNNTLSVSEANNTAGDTVFFGPGAIATASGFLLYYMANGGTFAGGVTLITGLTDDAVNIFGTSAPTTIFTGGGNDVISVVALAGSVGSVLNGPLTIDAGPGFNTINVAESNNAGDDNFTLGSTSISSTDGWTINYTASGGSFLGGINVFGGQGNDTFTVPLTGAPLNVAVDGGGGLNSLIVQDLTNGGITRNVSFGPGAGEVVASSGSQGSSSIIMYRNIAGLSATLASPAQDFVRSLFHQIFQRNASSAEEAQWLQVLNTSGRLAVVQGLELSLEGRTDLVNNWYLTYFGRLPTPAEAQPLINRLLAGQNEDQVLALVLGNAVVTSSSFRSSVIFGYFERLLHRAPSQAELNGWVFSSLDLGKIRQLIEISDEYFAVGT
jgi:hypothetical protein